MGGAGLLTTRLPEVRARAALETVGLDPHVPMSRASSVTNEVWLAPDVVVRINPRHDVRLRREAQLAQELPRAVGYPEVLGCGTGTGYEWLVMRRSPGQVLSRCWPTMPPAERRAAVAQLAVMLRALHQAPAPTTLAPLPDAPQLLMPGPNPIAPLLRAIESIRHHDHIDKRLVEWLVAYAERTAPALGQFDTPTLVHGDLTFENVLWDGERITSMLDFEWARAAPPDVELDVLARFCAFPFLHVAVDYEAETRADDYTPVLRWLHEDYPELFAGRHLVDRLRLYAICFEVRELLAYPPNRPAAQLSEHHPLRRLTRLAAGTSHLD